MDMTREVGGQTCGKENSKLEGCASAKEKSHSAVPSAKEKSC